MRSITGICSALSTHVIPCELRYLACRFQCTLGSAILDVGCGRGEKTLYIADSVRSSQGYVIGIDLDLELVSYAKELSKKLNLYSVVDFICADAHMLPLRSGCVGAVLLWNVLMFVVDDKQVILETRRVLQDRGVIVVSVYRVKRGYRNYDVVKLIRLITSCFIPISIRFASKDQVVVTALKPRSVYVQCIQIPLDNTLLSSLLSQSGLHMDAFNDDYSAYLLLVKKNRIEPIVSSVKVRKVNAVLLTYFVGGNIEKLRNLLMSLLKEGKCLLSHKELIEKLAAIGVPRSALQKAFNDLARLGIVRKPNITSEIVDLCEYIPMINTLRGPIALNPILRLITTEQMNRDTLAYILAASIITGNPLIRYALFESLKNSRSNRTELRCFANALNRAIQTYWKQCTNTNDVCKQELEHLNKEQHLVERLLSPLSSLGVIELQCKEIIFKEFVVEILNSISY